MEAQSRNDIMQLFIKKNHNFLDGIRENEFKEWIEQYMQDDTAEDEKILEYEVGTAGYSTTNDDSGIIKVTFNFNVQTYSESSIWNNTSRDRNTCYIELEILDENNYQINYIGSEPKNLAEFKKQFEEYKRQNDEIIVVPAEEVPNYNSQQVKEISSNITLVASILIGLSIVFVIWKLVRMKK